MLRTRRYSDTNRRAKRDVNLNARLLVAERFDSSLPQAAQGGEVSLPPLLLLFFLRFKLLGQASK